MSYTSVQVSLSEPSCPKKFRILRLKHTAEVIGCKVFRATEDGSVGIEGLVTDALVGVCSNWQPGGIYACGPMGMLMAVAAFAHERGLPAQLSFEALIRCGIGLCGSCELLESVCLELGKSPGFLVCHDGPVVKL